MKNRMVVKNNTEDNDESVNLILKAMDNKDDKFKHQTLMPSMNIRQSMVITETVMGLGGYPTC